ncbi:MAG: 50S ribosomal protein L30 [Calditrichaeota bacterium]|nr:MAG: 50S ribosomal protein L30 [Calditrichota bacterium]
MARKKSKEKMLKITQVRSLIGQRESHRRTIKALGLRRIRHTVIKQDTPQIRGMVEKVRHLVTVEETE